MELVADYNTLTNKNAKYCMKIFRFYIGVDAPLSNIYVSTLYEI